MTTVHQHLQAFRQRLQYRWMPVLSRWLVLLSTVEARAKLEHGPVVRILVDNTVLNHAITHETAWVSTGHKCWGPHTQATGYAARIPVHSVENTSDECKNIQYLPGIALLAEQGHIELYS